MENKKYTRGQNQTTVTEQQNATNNIESSTRLLETQNNETSVSRFEKFRSRCPKKVWRDNYSPKILSDQLQEKCNRAPLTSMENVMSKKVAMKKENTPRKINNSLNFSSSRENVQIYNITYHSKKDIDKELLSINF